MLTHGFASEWMHLRSAVWISDRFGIVARTKPGHWLAYPIGGRELGPFESREDAQAFLEQLRADKEGQS